MPEGDSLHRAARRLQVLVGERVEAESPNPRGQVTGVASRVDGRRLESVNAVGKHLLLHFEGGVVVRSHLRMNGRWRVRRRTDAAWRGSPWLVLRSREWEATQWNGPVLALGTPQARDLGPDLLAPATNTAEAVSRLRRNDQSRLVGEALVDQRLVAGIGNMWLAEALWHGRISPWSRLASVRDDELRVRSTGRAERCASPWTVGVRRARSIAVSVEAVRAAATPWDHEGWAKPIAPRTGARGASRRANQRRGRDSNPSTSGLPPVTP